MWIYEKKLEFPIDIKKSDARLILFPGNMDGGLVFQISEEDLL